MTELELAQQERSKHKAACPVCRINGSAWSDCPVGTQLARRWALAMANEHKARIGPMRYYWEAVKDRCEGWFFSPRESNIWISSPGGEGPLFVKPSRWELVKACSQFFLALFVLLISPRVIIALYVGLRAFLHTLFR